MGRLFSNSLYGAGINDDVVHALCALEGPKQLFALTAPGATTCTATSGKKAVRRLLEVGADALRVQKLGDL